MTVTFGVLIASLLIKVIINIAIDTEEVLLRPPALHIKLWIFNDKKFTLVYNENETVEKV